MTSDYPSTYGPRFWDQLSSGSHRNLMLKMAEALNDTFHPHTVLEVGCGNGALLSYFDSHGVSADGWEHPMAKVDPGIAVWRFDLNMLGDVNMDMRTLGDYDLVVCIELAEHLQPSTGPGLVRTLTKMARDVVWFSAATPGQGGDGHINERPPQYWDARFKECGFVRDEETTAKVRELYEPAVGTEWWYRNCRVYRRKT